MNGIQNHKINQIFQIGAIINRTIFIVNRDKFTIISKDFENKHLKVNNEGLDSIK